MWIYLGDVMDHRRVLVKTVTRLAYNGNVLTSFATNSPPRKTLLHGNYLQTLVPDIETSCQLKPYIFKILDTLIHTSDFADTV